MTATAAAVGSLFSGYGGLDLAVADVLGGAVAWHCENDPAASRLLAHHWPDVPNLGDITAVDWSQVAPVDVLTGGFPCQDVSHAGKRLGLKPGTRSGLWSHMAYAVDQLRPALVVAENVRGLLSAEAGGDLEPCPWCVGDGESGALRALGAVLGDLAGLGYDARWTGVRASDVGAPHGRFRVFVVAHPQGDPWRIGDRDSRAAADADGFGHQRPRNTRGRRPGPTDSGRPTPTDAARDGRHEGRPQPTRIERGPDAPLSGTAPADADSASLKALSGRPGTGDAGRREPLVDRSTAWGPYEPAIRRWEHTLGRLAPAPTEPNTTGGQRLSPAFVEWLMGLDDGHVTAVPGLSRNDQLKALGNGVVPQQAAFALSRLMESP